MPHMSTADRRFMARAIEISPRSLTDGGKTPFGSIVVVNGDIVGEGTSSVVELHDPTAHAEVMALREAGNAPKTHLLPAGTMSARKCGHCGFTVQAAVIAQTQSYAPEMVAWLRCTACHRGLVVNEIGGMAPSPVVGEDIEGLPDDVVRAYDEARVRPGGCRVR